MMDERAHEGHEAVERDFLGFIGADAGLVLKGGTALKLCYGLDRYSEDLDFDAASQRADTIGAVERFCADRGYECHVKKDTSTVQRCTIHYGGVKPLKVETSYRRQSIDADELAIVGGIATYKLDALALMKLSAFTGRDRIRDLHDVAFIIEEHWDELSEQTRNAFRYGLASKGLEQFDLVLSDQSDDLIDADALALRFLRAYDKIGLLASDQDERIGHHDAHSQSAPSLHSEAQLAKRASDALVDRSPAEDARRAARSCEARGSGSRGTSQPKAR